MKKIQILLSTYNGELYLEEQLNSIINQNYRQIEILVRDDGSKDTTVDVLNRYDEQDNIKLKIVSGHNIGVINSFFYLLKNANSEADYFCFCDQDDVWFPDKIERAVNYLRSKDDLEPAMYFTSTKLTDGNLNPLRNWPSNPRKAPSFYNALIQNIAPGVTIMINKKARDLLVKKSVNTEHVLMHDWWTYLCVSAFGEIYYEESPSVFYRQHGNNVVGGEHSFADKARKKWSSFKKHRGERLLFKQAKEFARLYGEELEVTKKQQLDLFLQSRQTVIDRLRFLSKTKLYRQTLEEQLLFKFLILIGYV